MLRVSVNPTNPEALRDLATLLEQPAIAAHVQIDFEGRPAPRANGKANGAPADVEPIVHGPRWAKHSKGRARSWTAKWEGMALRVEKHATKVSGVVFNGFVDNDFVGANKSVVQCRGRVEAAALARVKKTAK